MGKQLGQITINLFTNIRNFHHSPVSDYFCSMIMSINPWEDTIIALITPAGRGAVGVIRISGPDTIPLLSHVFPKAQVNQWPSHTPKLAQFYAGQEKLDEVLVTLFRAPKSYTREEVAEISLHGSPYILRQAINTLLKAGARMANPGEFTQRAWLNGALDLTQAEAVADLIAAESALAHKAAFSHLKGGFSDKLQELRTELLTLAALLELELDFAEEDVEFADRTQLLITLQKIQTEVTRLSNSFQLGNAIRNGIPTAIIGKPNAGKSTLLNALLKEQKAIVSDIPGTTRDIIEDKLFIGGGEFRLMDTAGIRATEDVIEQAGIQKTKEAIASAQIILYVLDSTQETPQQAVIWCENNLSFSENTQLIILGNKSDLLSNSIDPDKNSKYVYLPIAAKTGQGIEALLQTLTDLAGFTEVPDVLVTQARHQEALLHTTTALNQVQLAFEEQLPTDLIARDLRDALYHLGTITGEISPDEILGSIFSKFCIGK